MTRGVMLHRLAHFTSLTSGTHHLIITKVFALLKALVFVRKYCSTTVFPYKNQRFSCYRNELRMSCLHSVYVSFLMFLIKLRRQLDLEVTGRCFVGSRPRSRGQRLTTMLLCWDR